MTAQKHFGFGLFCLGVFKKRSLGLVTPAPPSGCGCDFPQVARDVDGSGNYFILTHKHVAQIHPQSAYGAKSPKLGLPEWVLYHEHSFAEDNCLRTITPITPEQ